MLQPWPALKEDQLVAQLVVQRKDLEVKVRGVVLQGLVPYQM